MIYKLRIAEGLALDVDEAGTGRTIDLLSGWPGEVCHKRLALFLRFEHNSLLLDLRQLVLVVTMPVEVGGDGGNDGNANRPACDFY